MFLSAILFLTLYDPQGEKEAIPYLFGGRSYHLRLT